MGLRAFEEQYIRLDKPASCLHTSANMLLAQADPDHSTLLLLFAAIAALYVAGRLAINALAGGERQSAGRRAIGQWIPIAATTLAAVLMKHPEMVASLVIGTSIACLSMALGMAILLAPMTDQTRRHSVWAFVCPAAIVVMMAGFKGELVWWHGIVFLLLGASILAVWHQKPSTSSITDACVSNSASRSLDSTAIIILLISLAFAGVGAWLAVRQTPIAGMNSRWMSTGMLASLILSPLLALPTFVTITHVAQRGDSNGAISSLVGTVLLNLCLLLPLAIFIQFGLTAFGARAQADGNALAALGTLGQALPYPAAVWRLDTIILITLGFLLIPVSMGRWLIGASTALCLSLGYMFYLVINFVLLIRH